jgi:hypothetical protein
MSRKLRLVGMIMVVLLLTAAGCNDNMTAWGLTAPDSDVNLRLGGKVGDNGEVFGEVGYNSSSFNDDGTPDRIGGGFIYHLTQEIQWEDTPDPSPFADILSSLQARPYIGIGCMADRGTQTLEGKYIAGVTFAVSPEMPWAFVAEWQEGDGLVTVNDDSAVFFGARFRY